jgi:hypothetical protein
VHQHISRLLFTMKLERHDGRAKEKQTGDGSIREKRLDLDAVKHFHMGGR